MRFVRRASAAKLLALAVAASHGTVKAEDPAEFKNWAVEQCVKANKPGEVIFEKTDGSEAPYAKFDWQQAACSSDVETSGGQPTGVVTYYMALRRSEFMKTPAAARQAPISVSLSVHVYKLYFRRLEGRWGVVAYRPVANTLTTALSEYMASTDGQVFYKNDFASRKGIWEVPVAAMAPMLGVAANTACAARDVVCAPASAKAGG
jgi:hypothetical protein